MSRIHRRRGLVVALTTLAVAAAGLTSSAVASDGTRNAEAEQLTPAALTEKARDLGITPSSLSELMEHAKAQPAGSLPGAEGQAPQEVADLAADLWADRPAGFGDVEWDQSQKEATVWWHGTPPESIAKRVAGLSTPASFKSMRYPRQELEAEAKRVLAAGEDLFGTITVNTDGTGLVATVESQDAQRSAAAQIDSAFPLEIDVVEGGVTPAVSPDDRKHTPYFPYAGGANMLHQSNATWCTSGWPVLIDAPHASLPRTYGMMFADHYIDSQPNDGIWVTWPDPQDGNRAYFFGSTSRTLYRSHDQDVALMVNQPSWTGINDPDLIYYPYVYVGPHVGASRYIVDRSRVAVIGENWCLGGALSGTTCGNQVTSTGVYYNLSHGQVGPMMRTVNPTQAAAGQGDSGGPVHTITTGSAFAQVGGIISAIESPHSACRANNDGRLCSRIVLSAQYWSIQDNGLAIRAMTASNYTEDM